MSSYPMSITISEEKYPTKEEFLEAVAHILKILTDNDYVCVFRYEDCGIYTIEYDYEDSDLSELTPVWLNNEEVETIFDMREKEIMNNEP